MTENKEPTRLQAFIDSSVSFQQPYLEASRKAWQTLRSESTFMTVLRNMWFYAWRLFLAFFLFMLIVGSLTVFALMFVGNMQGMAAWGSSLVIFAMLANISWSALLGFFVGWLVLVSNAVSRDRRIYNEQIAWPAQYVKSYGKNFETVQFGFDRNESVILHLNHQSMIQVRPDKFYELFRDRATSTNLADYFDIIDMIAPSDQSRFEDILYAFGVQPMKIRRAPRFYRY